MTLLLLVPGVISLYLVLRGRVNTAFLSVYLPCLLCLPDDYRLRIPHLPPTSVAEFALIPLGAVAFVKLIRNGSFTLMDLLVVLYSASIGLSEILHAPLVNDGIFSAIGAFIAIFLAYLAGRTLIEPNLRIATVRRFVFLFLLNCLPGLWEWRMAQSLYGVVGQRILGVKTIAEFIQIRDGHGRMGSLFADSEGEGIAFAMAFCLDAWLVYLRRVKASIDLGETLTKLERYHLPAILFFLCVLLTQARGPLIALFAGLLILQIPRFKHTKLMSMVVAIILVGGYLAASAYFASYTNVSNSDPASISEQQSSARYRRVMNELYPPIAEEGGWTGYSVLGIPHILGMKSIDNQYLLVHLAWGRLGYFLFIMIAWENVRILVVRSWKLRATEDRAFIFSMLAAMSVLWITLLTVFMGGQLPQVSFLMIGWIQSTGKPKADGFSFGRVFS